MSAWQFEDVAALALEANGHLPLPLCDMSPAEQEIVDRFGIFEPEEREAALVETVARAICAADGETHGVTWEEFDRFERDLYRRLATAAIAAYRAAQPPNPAEEALRRVEALADHAIADRIRAALAPQADDGTREGIWLR